MAQRQFSIINKEKSLECSICLSDFTKPKLLPCLHTFCMTCLKRYCEEIDEEEKPCPLCRRGFTVPEGGVELLRDDSVMARLVLEKEIKEGKQKSPKCELCEKEDAQAFCMECRQNLCSACKNAHLKCAGTKLHKIVSMQVKPSEIELSKIKSNYCAEHKGEEIKLYCCDCKKLLCYTCHATEHNKHMCKVPSHIAKLKIEEIKADQNDVEGCVEKENKRKEIVQDESNEYHEYIAEVRDFIDTSLSEIISFFTKQKLGLLQTIDKMKSQDAKVRESSKDLSELRLTELDSFLSYSRMMMERGTDCEIIRASDELHNRAQELINSQDKCHEDTPAEKYRNVLDFAVEKIRELQRQVSEKDLHQAFEITHSYMVSSGEQDEIFIESNNPVQGVTVIDCEIFMVKSESTQVQVYNSHTLKPKADINIPDMKNPQGLAGCSRALFISDEGLQCIHKIHLTNREAIERWKINKPNLGGVSMTRDDTLIVTIGKSSKVLEYSYDGKIIRKIHLGESMVRAWHTVRLNDLYFSDQFIISHGDVGHSLYGLCVINTEEEIIASCCNMPEYENENERLLSSLSIAIDNNVYSNVIFVAGGLNYGISMYSRNLHPIGHIKTTRNFTGKCSICFDASSKRLFVGGDTGVIIISPSTL